MKREKHHYVFVAVVFVAFNAWLSPLGLTRERIQHEFVAMSDFANSLRRPEFGMKEAAFDTTISMEHFMRRRLERVKEYCNYMPKDDVLEDLYTKEDFSKVDLPLVVDDKNKLIYCEMPKVGSTNWKRVFMKLTNPAYENVPVSEISGGRKYDENGLKKLTDYPAAVRKEMMETYFKFTMVRNPFERLLSGYRDKGWNGYFPIKEVREGPEKEYRLGANNTKVDDFDTQDKLGFNAFLDDLIQKGPEYGVGGHFGVRTRHWTRYNDICHFCAVDYQMIAKVENVDDEADFILSQAGLGDKITYPKREKATDKSTLFSYYAAVPREKIEKVYSTYAVDFEMFGYSFPES